MKTKVCSSKNIPKKQAISLSKDIESILLVLKAKITWLNTLNDPRFAISITETRGSTIEQQILIHQKEILQKAEEAEFFFGINEVPSPDYL